jgi:pimeloyl-ACP methyl ester carboxylesterase
MENSTFKLSCGRNISYCKSGSSGPTLIFEAGVACGKEYWGALQRRLSRDFSTFTYDRSGLGGSDPDCAQKSLDSITQDLEQLLTMLKVSEPFIFVGHSFGGLLAKHYSHHFKESTFGVVFVDSSDPHFKNKIYQYRTEAQKTYWEKIWNRVDTFSEEEHAKDYIACLETLELSKNMNIRSDIPTQILVCDNLNSWFDPDLDDFLSFENAPRKILERDNITWIESHREWLDQAPKAKFLVAENCTHNIPYDNEDLVYSSIIETVQSITP